ncbi:MAG: hypothetical protein WC008_03770 [Bacilli bacterium]
MEIVYVALGLMVIALGYNQFYLPYRSHKQIVEKLTKLEDKGYMMTSRRDKLYDYLLENEEVEVYIKCVFIPKHSNVTINAKSTWRLSWGGNPSKLGRSFPHHRYMPEIEEFSKWVIKKDKKVVKLFMLYPHTEKVLMYLNESELEIVTPLMTPYGYKVSNFSTLEEEIELLIK